MFTNCKQLNLTAADGKKYATDVVDSEGVNSVIAVLPGRESSGFVKWLSGMGTTPDEKSKQKAYVLYESGFIQNIETGTVRGPQQIHSYIFGGLYDSAGQTRDVNIAKGGLVFAPSMFLKESLASVEKKLRTVS